jgi:hypothetical protein
MNFHLVRRLSDHKSTSKVYAAASDQGGNPSAGTSVCVPGFQNSAQGQRLNRLRSVVGEGNDYIVEIGGWDCNTNRPIVTPTNCVGTLKRDTSSDQSINQGMAASISCCIFDS